jgi:transposase InsO family protein
MLITDQGWLFISSFFKEMFKIPRIRQVNTSSYHSSSNGMIERWHWSLHSGLSHYIDSVNTNWDTLVPFCLLAYCAAPNTTDYSTYFLLHRREMTLPNSKDVKARLSREKENSDQNRQLESMKSSFKLA